MTTTDFREKLFLTHLMTEQPASAEFVQVQAEECCKVWGHDYVEDAWKGGYPASPQTIGGTPVVSNAKCRRCGRERHPTESR